MPRPKPLMMLDNPAKTCFSESDMSCLLGSRFSSFLTLLKSFTKPEDTEGVPAGTPDLETQAANLDPEAYKAPLDPAHSDKFDVEKE